MWWQVHDDLQASRKFASTQSEHSNTVQMNDNNNAAIIENAQNNAQASIGPSQLDGKLRRINFASYRCQWSDEVEAFFAPSGPQPAMPHFPLSPSTGSIGGGLHSPLSSASASNLTTATTVSSIPLSELLPLTSTTSGSDASALASRRPLLFQRRDELPSVKAELAGGRQKLASPVNDLQEYDSRYFNDHDAEGRGDDDESRASATASDGASAMGSLISRLANFAFGTFIQPNSSAEQGHPK